MNKFKLLLAFAASLLIVACGPFKSYQYIQPSTASGKQCVNQCMSTKQMCESSCRSQFSNCQSFGDISNSLAKDKKAKKKIKNSDGRCNHENNVCRDSCEENYNPCFTNCGGRIVEKKK